MSWLPDFLSLNILLFCVAVTLAGGIVKGAVGFALPLIMVSGMGIVLEPAQVIAGLILPIVVANVMQALRGGAREAVQVIWEFRYYLAVFSVLIVITAQFVTIIPPETMYLCLGVPVTFLCLLQLSGVQIKVAPQHRNIATVISASLSGILGGIAGTWGPTTVLYLVALDTPKARQIAIQGVIYGIGAVLLFFGHMKSGVLTLQTIPFSALLLIPSMIGIRIGFALHDRIDQDTFKRMTLLVLLIAGLNLVRKGLI